MMIRMIVCKMILNWFGVVEEVIDDEFLDWFFVSVILYEEVLLLFVVVFMFRS